MKRSFFASLLVLALAVGIPGMALAGPTIGDTDGDGVDDLFDNCTNQSNTAQTDADGDGCGNRCDGDFDQTDVTGITDFVVLQGCFGDPVGTPGPPDDPTCSETDMDDTGVTGITDFVAFVGEFGTPPGPSLSPIADPTACSP